MDYKEKYLKYKSKYLKLKTQQIGGGWSNAEDYGKSCQPVLNLEKWEINQYDVDYKDKTLTFNIIKYFFEESKDKPVLFAMAGISTKSFSNSAKVVVDNIEKLKGKFSSVYMINYDPLKQAQIDVCGKYNELKDKKISMLRSDLSDDEELNEMYEGEIKLNIEIATLMNEIISNKLRLDNVHLLGKCNGGFVCLELVSMDDRYKALYLAVPGSPIHVKPLYKLSPKRLEEIVFIFGWNDNDDYKFNFTPESRMEKKIYDEEMIKLGEDKNVKLKYESHMFESGNGHEINSDLLDQILKE